ncbi:MAG: T9SS type A sorting domain-containing protein, partial [Raineya sp.]|nr:T9SS type A sorting domain-containing protein [Raineya sp.]
PMVVDPVSSQTIRYADPPFVINDISTIFNDPDGDPLTYTISASPTGVVNISQTGNQVTFTATDINTTTITITANDGKGGAASDSFTITVQRGTQTITFEPISTKFVDESPVTLNAVSNRGLPITFSVIAGTATIAGNTVVFNQAGTITVRASQPGNYYFEPAPSVEQTFQVIKRNQVINFEPVADKVITESGFELNVSASSGLPVTLEVVSGNVTLNGKKVIFNSIGFVTIRASQAGNNVYHPAEPVERSFYVAPENLQLTLQPNPFSGEGFNAILRGKYLGKVQIIVFDNTGRVISNVTFEKQTYFSDTFVKTPQIAPDTYYCKVITDERTFVEKIVKQ